MLKFKNQNTTTIRFLITAIETKTTHNSSFPTNSKKINHRRDMSNRIIFKGKK